MELALQAPISAPKPQASDTAPGEYHTYTVTLQTGDVRWGGTDAQVYVSLRGDRFTTAELPFRRTMLKRGSVVEDRICAPAVGNILSITIRHDGVGWGGAWNLERVTLFDEDLLRSWSFLNAKWLNSENRNLVTLAPIRGVGAGQRASRRRSSVFHRVEAEDEESAEDSTTKVLFQVTYYTRDCLTLYVVGSSKALGSWQIERALLMNRIAAYNGSWRGDWELEVELDDVNGVEYKYVCIDDLSKKRVWESGLYKDLNLQPHEREVRLRDRLVTPDAMSAKKRLAADATARLAARAAPTPVRMMELGDRSPFSAAMEDAAHDHSRPELEPDELSARVKELESALLAARTIARGRERELAALRARSLISPRNNSHSPPPASNDQRVAAAEMAETLHELRTNLSSFSKTLHAPVHEMMSSVASMREVVVSTVEAVRRRSAAAEEAKLSSQLDTVESSKQTLQLNEQLQQTVEELRRKEADAQQRSHEAEQLQLASLQSLEAAKDRWRKEFAERRRLFNMVQELKGNIRVFCRVRPPRKAQSTCGVNTFVDDGGERRRIAAGGKSFEFDRVFDAGEGQEAVYSDMQALATSVFDGYNVCIFAYGQTGSGKTYTMNGSDEDPGVNFRALRDLYRIREERSDAFRTSIHVSMVEIYNETLRDLLGDQPHGTGAHSTPKLEIKKGANGVFVGDLTTLPCESADEVWSVIRRGCTGRSSGATSMNEYSSRSHLIVSVQVQCTSVDTNRTSIGNLNLVDLAGSERVSKSNATGDRLREASHINKSLAALGDVFMAILARNGHVPYRNSKLTYLLQESLGGSSKTLMVVNVAPEETELTETQCSLMFATRVAKVELGAASKRSESNELARLSKDVQERDGKLQLAESQLQELQRRADEAVREREQLATTLRSEVSQREQLSNALRQAEASQQQLRIEQHERAATLEQRLRELERRHARAAEEAQQMHQKGKEEHQREVVQLRQQLAEALAQQFAHTTPSAAPVLAPTVGPASDMRSHPSADTIAAHGMEATAARWRGNGLIDPAPLGLTVSASPSTAHGEEGQQESRKRPKVRFGGDVSTNEADAGDAVSAPATRSSRNVHFAPTVSTVTSSGGVAASAAGKSSNGAASGSARGKGVSSKEAAPVALGASVNTNVPPKRMVYAFGSRVEAPAAEMENINSNAVSAPAMATSKKAVSRSFSRPAERVIAGSTPAAKNMRTPRRFLV